MIDLEKIPASLIQSRGLYSTIRSAHEDELKSMQMLCGQLSSLASQILRRVQPTSGEPERVTDLLETARTTLALMDASADNIISLAAQRAQLKPLAWPK